MRSTRAEAGLGASHATVPGVVRTGAAGQGWGPGAGAWGLGPRGLGPGAEGGLSPDQKAAAFPKSRRACRPATPSRSKAESKNEFSNSL